MNLIKLCPHCKRGKESLELDSRSFICPYINCHNGKTCSKFEKLETTLKKSFWKEHFVNFKIHK